MDVTLDGWATVHSFVWYRGSLVRKNVSASCMLWDWIFFGVCVVLVLCYKCNSYLEGVCMEFLEEVLGGSQ